MSTYFKYLKYVIYVYVYNMSIHCKGVDNNLKCLYTYLYTPIISSTLEELI